jgi:hypothetical protein
VGSPEPKMSKKSSLIEQNGTRGGGKKGDFLQKLKTGYCSKSENNQINNFGYGGAVLLVWGLAGLAC